MKTTEARNLYIKAWKEQNKARSLEISREWKQRNKEHCQEYFKKWASANPEKHLASHATATENYRKKNPAYYAAYTRTRKANKLSATPQWANLDAIKVEYDLAAWCTNVMGVPYHVDHIVPLKGRNVCGLHVENNLQVIPAKVNQSKNNKFKDMLFI